MCNSLIAYYVEHVFVCLFAIWCLLWWGAYEIFCQIFNWALYISIVVWRVLCLFWMPALNHMCILQIFSPIYGLSFHLANSIFNRAEDLILMKPNFSIFFSSWIMILWCYLKGQAKPKVMQIFACVSLLGVLLFYVLH